MLQPSALAPSTSTSRLTRGKSRKNGTAGAPFGGKAKKPNHFNYALI
jgi:hypothetical protein